MPISIHSGKTSVQKITATSVTGRNITATSKIKSPDNLKITFVCVKAQWNVKNILM